MKLYHGSNCEVMKPKIISNLRALDFGAGFYLTSSESQAIRWARLVTKRRRSGEPTLNIYEFEVEQISVLEVVKFENANEKWLDFVVSNRREDTFINKYDLVIGPVANDNTLPVIDDYMDGK